MKKTLATFATALLFALFAAPAFAQWQVPNHAVPVGTGAGQGFHYAASGTAGQLLIDQGSGANPAFEPITGDCGITSAGVLTCTKLHGVAYPASPSTNTVPVVTSTNTVTYEAVPNAALANSAVTVAGHSISLGASQALVCADLTNATASCSTDTTQAGNISGGTLPAARMPALTGDATSTVGTVATTVGKVNGVTYGTSPSTNTVAVVTGTNATTYEKVPVAAGGTGIGSGTSGGVPYFNSSSTIASSAALTANALTVGGGAGVAPASLASLGTTTSVLHGNAAGLPTFGAVSLTTDVSGNLPVTNLNSGTGASSSSFWRGDGSWATPSGAGTVTNSAGNLTANQVVIGNGTTDLKVLGSLGTTTTLLHGNAAGAPTFSAVGLTTDVTGTLPVANGGTNSTTGAVTGVLYTVITSSTTFTPNANELFAVAECIGAGGGGGAVVNSSSGQQIVGGGGGGGGRSIWTGVISGTPTVTIGAGGASSSAGGDTSVAAVCIGKGGSAGGVAGYNGVGGAGGVAGTGNVLTSPGPSGGWSFGAIINTVIDLGGIGASSLYGGGGIPGSTNQAGGAATGRGAGGGGAASQNAGGAFSGGAGSTGLVIIEEFLHS